MLHLIHPACVHLSVAFLTVGGAMEACGHLFRREGWVRFGGTLLILGTLALLPTLATGYLAANSVPIPPAAEQVLSSHERNGWILLGLCGAALLWKGFLQGKIADGQRHFYAILLLVIVGLTVYSGILGGEMVYGHGVGTELVPTTVSRPAPGG